MSTHNTTVIVTNQQPTNFGIIPLFIVIGFVCLVINFWWQIMLAFAIISGVAMLYIRLRDLQLRDRALAARADEQNHLFLAGDPRGIYGGCSEGSQQ